MIPTIRIEENKVLEDRISKSKKHPSKVIASFIIELFGNQKFEMSDGLKIIIDNTDSKKLSLTPSKKRRLALGNLRNLIDIAVYGHSDMEATHKKFKSFRYYFVNIEFGDDAYEICLNVGTNKYDGKNHLYAITEGTPTNYGDSRLQLDNVKGGFSIQDVPSNKNISQ